MKQLKNLCIFFPVNDSHNTHYFGIENNSSDRSQNLIYGTVRDIT